MNEYLQNEAMCPFLLTLHTFWTTCTQYGAFRNNGKRIIIEQKLKKTGQDSILQKSSHRNKCQCYVMLSLKTTTTKNSHFKGWTQCGVYS